MGKQENPDERDLRYLRLVANRARGFKDEQTVKELKDPDIDSPQVLYRTLKSDGHPICPVCGTTYVEERHCENPEAKVDGRRARRGEGTQQELPPPAEASHKPRADKLDPEVWGFVSNLLKTPDLLRAGLERLVEEQRSATRGNPNREAEVWAKRLAEVEQKRSAYQDQQAEGLITLNELRSKLAILEETRDTARRELATLRERRELIEHLEQDANALLEHYASMVPEALDGLTPEERHRIYKMMRINVSMYAGGLVEVTGAFSGLLNTREVVSVKDERTSSSTATSRTSRRRVTGRRTASR